jgi:hypothetical protein
MIRVLWFFGISRKFNKNFKKVSRNGRNEKNATIATDSFKSQRLLYFPLSSLPETIIANP